MLAALIQKLLNRAAPFTRNTLNEIDVLIHKDARRNAAHGYVVASNRALNIKKAAVAVVFPDFEAAPELSHRLMTDLWEAMHAQGWVPSHIASWAGVRALQEDGTASGEDEHTTSYQTTGFSSAAVAEARLTNDISAVPAFLRREPTDDSVLKFPRRRIMNSPIYEPEVQMALDSVKRRVRHLEEIAREAALVRFVSIVENALATGKGVEFIRDKLNAAAQTILSVHLHATPAEASH
jgi:hypothetical protein